MKATATTSTINLQGQGRDPVQGQLLRRSERRGWRSSCAATRPGMQTSSMSRRNHRRDNLVLLQLRHKRVTSRAPSNGPRIWHTAHGGPRGANRAPAWFGQ